MEPNELESWIRELLKDVPGVKKNSVVFHTYVNPSRVVFELGAVTGDANYADALMREKGIEFMRIGTVWNPFAKMYYTYEFTVFAPGEQLPERKRVCSFLAERIEKSEVELATYHGVDAFIASLHGNETKIEDVIGLKQKEIKLLKEIREMFCTGGIP